jgi:hypothetical protein
MKTIYRIQFFNNFEWVNSVFHAETLEEVEKLVKFLNETPVEHRYIILNEDK